ncbi:Calponin-homology (CH) domain-containing protein [Plasmodiophora brassicae]
MPNEYGLDKEIAEKIASKYDPAMEKEAQDWIEQVTAEKFKAGFQESLKSGVILCKLLNRIKPGTVSRINTQSMPFMQRENISYFLNGCRDLGMRNTDLFDTQDLYENKNIVHVIDSVFSLAAVARNVPGFDGPYLGTARLAQKNERQFSDQQMAKASAAPTLLGMGGYEQAKRVAQEAGPNIILDRQIIQNVDMIKQEQAKSKAAVAERCPECNAPNPNAKFCGECGSKLC